MIRIAWLVMRMIEALVIIPVEGAIAVIVGLTMGAIVIWAPLVVLLVALVVRQKHHAIM